MDPIISTQRAPTEEDDFVSRLPKLELHVHIEGTLSPSLRWELAQRNGISLPYDSLESLIKSYRVMYNHRKKLLGDNGNPTFLETYYGAMEVLRTEDDFYDLAMAYFKKAKSMNVCYAEPFFDIQAHTRRGVPVSTVMNGLRRARDDAREKLDVHSNWILCFLRDMSLESALKTYEAVAPYQGDVFHAIGLDSDEYDRPPSIFEPVFLRARADGLKVTAHCDFDQKDNLEHIRQVASCVAGTGADRIDHGLNAAEKPELINMIKSRGLGMTLCPHAYHRRLLAENVFPKVRKLFDAGIRITINSDDPAYMHEMWVSDNLHLVQRMCPFTNEEMVTLQKNAVEISWADARLKKAIMEKLDAVLA